MATLIYQALAAFTYLNLAGAVVSAAAGDVLTDVPTARAAVLISDGLLAVSSAPPTPVATRTASHTLLTGDRNVLVDATAGNVVVTLPLAAAVPAGREYLLHKTDSGANTVTVQRQGADTLLGGVTSKVLSAQGAWVELRSNGASVWSLRSGTG